jgi:hypothetical protein
MAASHLATKGRPAHGGKGWPSKVFEFNPAPADYGAEGYRVLWTLCGVAIGVLVMFLASLLAKRKSAAKQPVPAGQAG